MKCNQCKHDTKWHYHDPNKLGIANPDYIYKCEAKDLDGDAVCGCLVLRTDEFTVVAMAQSNPCEEDPYLIVLDEMRQLHMKKAADYGGNTGTDNLRASAEFGIQPWVGCVLRMNDKVTRIKSFVKNGRLENESIDDSLIDIAAYAILALCLLRESRDGPAE